MQRLSKSRDRRGRRRTTIRRAVAEAIQIKGPKARKRTTIRRTVAEVIQIKGPERAEKGHDK